MEKNDFLKLKPMLLDEIFKPFNDKDYLFEIKFDGIRSLIFIDKEKIFIKSRRNIILNDTFPELLDIKNISNETCIFDGEIVLLENGKPSFFKLQERTRLKNKYRINEMKENNPVAFICFDILYKNKDLTKLPLLDRKKILDKYNDNNIFIKSKYFEEKGNDLFKFVKKENLEGIIAKKKMSKYYYNIRTKEWIKIKNFKEEEFYISGFIITKSDNVVSALLSEKINNKYVFVGKILFSHKNKDYEKVINSDSVKNYLENCEDNAIFIKPIYKLKVNYMERTKNNMLRQPFVNKDNK
ncbi:MAG: hypothetical protein E7161_02240 [Firmicutes bacterium]|nr:hypothetical protein [Bacillota bacterium]